MVREPDTNIDFNGTLLLLNLYDIIKFILGEAIWVRYYTEARIDVIDKG